MTDPNVQEIAARLHAASIKLLRLLRREDDASGLSAPRLSALSVLVFGGPLSLAELAAAEQVRAPTMSRLVEGLVRAGLVTRETARSPGGERAPRARPRRRDHGTGRSLMCAAALVAVQHRRYIAGEHFSYPRVELR
jgi:hypothetical protein